MRQHRGLAGLCRGCPGPLSTRPTNIALGSDNLLLEGHPPRHLPQPSLVCTPSGLLLVLWDMLRWLLAPEGWYESMKTPQILIQEYEKLCSVLG